MAMNPNPCAEVPTATVPVLETQDGSGGRSLGLVPHRTAVELVAAVKATDTAEHRTWVATNRLRPAPRVHQEPCNALVTPCRAWQGWLLPW